MPSRLLCSGLHLSTKRDWWEPFLKTLLISVGLPVRISVCVACQLRSTERKAAQTSRAGALLGNRLEGIVGIALAAGQLRGWRCGPEEFD